MKCHEKHTYRSRMEAAAMLHGAQQSWALRAREREAWLQRHPQRADEAPPLLAPEPPSGIYQCPTCSRWHLTHWGGIVR